MDTRTHDIMERPMGAEAATGVDGARRLGEFLEKEVEAIGEEKVLAFAMNRAIGVTEAPEESGRLYSIAMLQQGLSGGITIVNVPMNSAAEAFYSSMKPLMDSIDCIAPMVQRTDRYGVTLMDSDGMTHYEGDIMGFLKGIRDVNRDAVSVMAFGRAYEFLEEHERHDLIISRLMHRYWRHDNHGFVLKVRSKDAYKDLVDSATGGAASKLLVSVQEDPKERDASLDVVWDTIRGDAEAGRFLAELNDRFAEMELRSERVLRRE